MSELAEVVFEAETPCFDGVEPCELSYGRFPTAWSCRGCNRTPSWAGSLGLGRWPLVKAVIATWISLLWITGCAHTPAKAPSACRIIERNHFGRLSAITVWSDGRYAWSYFDNHSFTGKLEPDVVLSLFDISGEFPVRDGFPTYEIQPDATYQVPPAVGLVRGLLDEIHLAMP